MDSLDYRRNHALEIYFFKSRIKGGRGKETVGAKLFIKPDDNRQLKTASVLLIKQSFTFAFAASLEIASRIVWGADISKSKRKRIKSKKGEEDEAEAKKGWKEQ